MDDANGPEIHRGLFPNGGYRFMERSFGAVEESNDYESFGAALPSATYITAPATLPSGSTRERLPRYGFFLAAIWRIIAVVSGLAGSGLRHSLPRRRRAFALGRRCRQYFPLSNLSNDPNRKFSSDGITDDNDNGTGQVA